jgi:hypothetical protein
MQRNVANVAIEHDSLSAVRRFTSLGANEHFGKFTIEAQFHVAYQDRRSREVRVAINEIAQVNPPLGYHKRSLFVDRIAVVDR